METRGRLIVLEGLDGSGKTTQLAKLAASLRSSGIPIFETCEPSDGPVGRLVREILAGRVETDQKTIALLFAADRTDHLLRRDGGGLKEKIAAGVTVLCDRYYFSSYAYHGVHLPMEWVIATNRLAADLLRPDLTVFLDLAPEACLARLRGDRRELELYENLESMRKVRAQFFAAFDRLKDEERVVVVPAQESAELVAEEVWTRVAPLFRRAGG